MIEVSKELQPEIDSIIYECKRKIHDLIPTPVYVSVTIMSKTKLPSFEKYSPELNAYLPTLIQNLISNYFDIPWDNIIKRNKQDKYVTARMSYMYITSLYSKRSRDEIAADIKRHPTAITHNLKVATDLLDTNDNKFLTIVSELTSQLKTIIHDYEKV